MINRLWVLSLAVVAALAMVSDVQAFGKRKKGGCATTGCDTCGGCGTGAHYGGCGDCGPCAAPCAPQISYVDQVITCYEQRLVTKTVPVQVQRAVQKTVTEPFTYQIQVPYTVKEPRQVPTRKLVTENVPYEVTIIDEKVVKVPQTIHVTKLVTENVPFEYVVNNEVVERVPQTIVTYTCVPRQVCQQVPVCRTVCVPVCDPCTCCVRYVQQQVTQHVTCCHTVYERVAHQQQITVETCRCVPTVKRGTRTVCRAIVEPQQTTVDTCERVARVERGTRTVCRWVEGTETIQVDVQKFRTENKTEQRQRIQVDYVTDTVQQQVTECVTVPVQRTVRVPVCQPCPPCPPMGYGGCGGCVGGYGGPVCATGGCCH